HAEGRQIVPLAQQDTQPTPATGQRSIAPPSTRSSKQIRSVRTDRLPRVLPVPGGDKKWYLYAARAGLIFGVASHRSIVSLNTIARGETRTNRLAPPPFSPIMARHRRWLADLSILGFAIPQPPVQARDLRDNHRLRRHPCRVIRRQTAGRLLQVLQPHGDVEPVEHRRLGDTGISQNAPQ